MGVLAKDVLDGLGFVDVVVGGRSAVGVEIIDLRGRDTGIIERHLHRNARTFNRRLDHILTVGRHAKT